MQYDRRETANQTVRVATTPALASGPAGGTVDGLRHAGTDYPGKGA